MTLGQLCAFAALGGALCAGCAPSAPPYAGCGDGVACEGARCIELVYTRDDGSEAGGSFCSERCSVDAECPVGGVCVSVDIDPPLRFLCAAPCTAPADCYAGSLCTELLGPSETLSVCLPDR